MSVIKEIFYSILKFDFENGQRCMYLGLNVQPEIQLFLIGFF